MSYFDFQSLQVDGLGLRFGHFETYSTNTTDHTFH